MSNRHYPPANLRYLKARLRNLSRPAFWGTAIFLSVLGLVIREYWSNPDAFIGKQNSEVTTQKTDDSLSAEDKAIAADIDNLPVLYNDVQQATGPIKILSPKDNSKTNQGKDFLQYLMSQQKSAKNTKLTPSLDINNNSSSSDERNPFITQTENLLKFSTQNSNTQSLTTSSQPQGVTVSPNTVSNGVNQSPTNSYNSISSSTSILPPSSTPTLSNSNGGVSTPSNVLVQNSYNGVPQNLSNNSGTAILSNPAGQASYNGVPQNLSNNSGTAILSNPAGQTSYNGVPQNLSTNNPTYIPNTNLNNSTGYIQPTVPNYLPNSYNNPVQPLPYQVPASAVTQPVTPSAPTNTQPYSVQPVYPNINSNQITPPTPASYTNSRYDYIRNQLRQSNFYVPGQSTGGVQGNGY
ncbi:hypothetical protein H6G76_04480 [Nostoc sp. FACHB-152]|uniref:hypothetical protein n=1 Tax=unclassified Nostoc TaxID=2593658 RepID=UPI001683A839|nr:MULTISPECIES: hypothetical protein [unclassified Nostoc]MBD2446427.1 hypothetical protein [Nostoc sp. FACHB-152]MBD2469618.1 hypothetical protein [Nostoc sp. FACHB-145]